VSVTHRLGLVVDADTIAVMDEGRVAEIGTHFKLLTLNGLYSKLWTAQQSPA
jgi:ABC-type multidrug transport system fused ATPase/permease subunit